MAKAIETGLPKMKIEEAAAIRQAQIDSKKEKIVGVNYRRLAQEDALDILAIDNSAVRLSQIARIERVRAARDNEKVQQALTKLTEAAESGTSNLLELAVEAARQRATLGEISDAIEAVSGRHKAIIRSISGVYSSNYSESHEVDSVKEMAEDFLENEGRRPRIMIAKMGQDGHDRGAKVIATAFADLGFDVDMGPLFQTPEETALQAVENDVHVIGVSSLAAGHLTLVPELKAELEKLGRGDILLVVGGVIPSQDYAFLLENGATAIFGPGTVIPVAAQKVIEEIYKQLGYEEAGSSL